MRNIGSRPAYYLNKIRGGEPRGSVKRKAPSQKEAEKKTNGGDELGLGVISILQEQLAKKDEQIDNLLSILNQQH